MNLKTLDKQVRYILERVPDTRNSDIALTIEVWKTFYGSRLRVLDHDNFTSGRKDLYVNVNDLYELPREDNVKRVRAKIQNDEKKFLPTEVNVAIKRGWKEAEWRSYLRPAAPVALF